MYQARLEELDRFERRAVADYEKQMRRLDGVEDADRIARLKARLGKDRVRFAANRREVEANRKGSHWAGSPPKKPKDDRR